jgi:hypothetical protein
MGEWSRAARNSAAHEFGRRHYRWYVASQYGGRLAVLGGVVAGIAAVVWLLRHAQAPLFLLGVAAALIAGVAIRVVWLLSPASRSRSGSGAGMVLAVLLAVACAVAAALLS